MLGQLNDQYKEATVIGAGFSGLLAAYRLIQKGYSVQVFEAQDRAGGLIQTISTPFGIAECAAHSLRSSPEVLALFDELQLEYITAQYRQKYILRNKKFTQLPLNPLEIIGLLGRLMSAKQKSAYANMEDWALHHLGRAALDHLITPMMHGIYAATPAELAVELVFPKLMAPEGQTLCMHLMQLKKKKPHHKPQVMAPIDGMGILTAVLEQKVCAVIGDNFRLGHGLNRLPDSPNIVIATTAPVAARLLRDFPKSAQALQTIDYAPLIAATVFLEKDKHYAPKGMGVLHSASENRKSLGILFNSSCFKNRVGDEAKYASYTVMLGGTSSAELLSLPDLALRQIIQDELQEILQLSAQAEHMEIVRWPQAIPLYNQTLKSALHNLQSDWCSQPGHLIAGNYCGEISLRGMIAKTSF